MNVTPESVITAPAPVGDADGPAGSGAASLVHDRSARPNAIRRVTVVAERSVGEARCIAGIVTRRAAETAEDG
jgi:hypothetical protein